MCVESAVSCGTGCSARGALFSSARVCRVHVYSPVHILFVLWKRSGGLRPRNACGFFCGSAPNGLRTSEHRLPYTVNTWTRDQHVVSGPPHHNRYGLCFCEERPDQPACDAIASCGPSCRHPCFFSGVTVTDSQRWTGFLIHNAIPVRYFCVLEFLGRPWVIEPDMRRRFLCLFWQLCEAFSTATRPTRWAFPERIGSSSSRVLWGIVGQFRICGAERGALGPTSASLKKEKEKEKRKIKKRKKEKDFVF